MTTLLSTLGTLYNLSKFVDIRKEFSPADKRLLSEYQYSRVMKVRVGRIPLNNMVGTALNILTIGQWEQAKAKYGYDKIFHLFMVLDVMDRRNNKIVNIVLEKNETPRLYKINKLPNSQGTEYMNVEKSIGITLGEFIGNAQASMKTKFWVYNAFDNNCQDFIIGVLGANHILTPQVRDFVKQPINDIVKELPSYTSSIATGITDISAKLRRLTGRGLNMV